RDDGAADRQRRYLPLLEPAHELRRWWFRQRLPGARRGRVKQGAVLRDDLVENVEGRERGREVVELAPGDEGELAAGLPDTLERGERGVVDVPVLCEGPVVIAGEDVVAHGQLRKPAVGARHARDRRAVEKVAIMGFVRIAVARMARSYRATPSTSRAIMGSSRVSQT